MRIGVSTAFVIIVALVGTAQRNGAIQKTMA